MGILSYNTVSIILSGSDDEITLPKFADLISVEAPRIVTDNSSLLVVLVVIIGMAVSLFILYMIKVKIFDTSYRSIRKINLLRREYKKGELSSTMMLSKTADVVRLYLSVILDVDVTTMTNTELFAVMSQKTDRINYLQRSELIELINDIELVVFADLPVKNSDVHSTVDRIVESIKIKGGRAQ